jgi:hypothetical protein
MYGYSVRAGKNGGLSGLQNIRNADISRVAKKSNLIDVDA